MSSLKSNFDQIGHFFGQTSNLVGESLCFSYFPQNFGLEFYRGNKLFKWTF
jgi:hypothetical protein